MAEIRTNASGEEEGFNGGYFETRFAFSEDRERLWSVLVRYLQKRYIPSDAVVLDIGAGYCHFINNVEAKEKHALDISPIVLRQLPPM